MDIEVDTYGKQTAHGWVNREGTLGPYAPGKGPRRDPLGEFPTGPEVGEHLPDVNCMDSDGNPFDFHKNRGDSPAILVFYRSAVW